MKNKIFKMSLMLLFSIFSIVKSEIEQTIHSDNYGIYKDTNFNNYTDKEGYILPAFQYGYNQDVTNWVDSVKNDISYPYYYDNDLFGSADALKTLNINNENNEFLGNPFETRYSSKINSTNDSFNKWTFEPKGYLNSNNFEKNKEKIYKNFKEPFYKSFETKDKYEKLMHQYLDENKQLNINDIPRYEEFLNTTDESLLDNFNTIINKEKRFDKNTYEFNNNDYNKSNDKNILNSIINKLKK